MSPTRVASLCSGYGGIELGLELAGVDVEVVWHAEYDDAPALVHGKHWPVPQSSRCSATVSSHRPPRSLGASWLVGCEVAGKNRPEASNARTNPGSLGNARARATLRTSPGQAHPELTGVDEDER